MNAHFYESCMHKILKHGHRIILLDVQPHQVSQEGISIKIFDLANNIMCRKQCTGYSNFFTGFLDFSNNDAKFF